MAKRKNTVPVVPASDPNITTRSSINIFSPSGTGLRPLQTSNTAPVRIPLATDNDIQYTIDGRTYDTNIYNTTKNQFVQVYNHTAVGLEGEVQYNFNGDFGSSSSFKWNPSYNILNVDGTFNTGPIHEQFISADPAELIVSITSSPPYYSVVISNGGSGFTSGQQFSISGLSLGGASPTNDSIFTVTTAPGSLDGAITEVAATNMTINSIDGVYKINLIPPSASNIYYLSSGLSSFSVTNYNLALNCCTNFLFVITQGATPVVPYGFSINGIAVQLLFPGGEPITGVPFAKDIVNISILRTGTNTYVGLAQIVSFA